MFSLFTDYYYIVLGLQAICAIHCIRKGNQNKWIWLIIFIPVIGCFAYIFTEIFTKNEIGHVQSGVSSIFNPTGKIKHLQDNLRFRDTFDNRLALADAYIAAEQFDSAIEIYEKSLVGTFAEHEHGNMQLIIAYSKKSRFQDVIKIAKKIYSLPQFIRSRPHMLYAMALAYDNQSAAAEKEFCLMKGKFSNYECRYYYGKFLKEDSRSSDAKQIFNEILNEASHLSSSEKRSNRIWFSKVKEELKVMETAL